jgi:hypothetical protein
MFIIWGFTGKVIEKDAGQFTCPNCRSLQPYIHKESWRYFTLYFLPLFKIQKLGDYVECQHCLTTFAPKTSNPNTNKIIHESKLIDGIKHLEAGMPFHLAFKKVVDAGIPQDVAQPGLYAKLGEKPKYCSRCRAIYHESMNFCAHCGQKLELTTP